MVLKHGDEGNELYILESGEVTVVEKMASGDEVELTTLGTGDYFGERALLTDEARFASVRATTKLSTVSISREGFEALFGEGTLTEAANAAR